MSRPAYEAAFRAWFGLTRAQAALLAELFDRAGRPAGGEELSGVIGRNARSVRNFMSELRHVMDDEAVDYVPGGGYQLTEAGMGECRAVLWKMGEELRAAGVDTPRT